MSHPKKHHFVPQFLLRGLLAEGNNQLWVFDKWTERSWKSPTRDIAAEHRFNLLKTADGDIDLEPFMGKMEDAVSPIVEKIRLTRSIKWLNAAARRQIALFVAAQNLRTPAALAKHRAISDFIKQAAAQQIGDLDASDECASFDRDDNKLLWGDVYVKETPKIAALLLMKDWLLFDSADTHFYMSDAPVTLFNHVNTPGRGNLGFSCEGIQVHFPINASLTLAFICPTIRQELRSGKRAAARNPHLLGSLAKRDAIAKADIVMNAMKTGRPLKSEPENVTFMNSLQVSNSERFVYSTDGDFELAIEMITTHPRNKTGRRPELAN